MLTGAHVLIYSKNAEADRAFFRDVLGFRAVDAGGGWLIFKLPPAEMALHPDEDDCAVQPSARTLPAELYLMCADLRAIIKTLAAKNVQCTAIAEEPWGIRTTLRLPSGGEMGLYQPTHPTAIDLR